MGKPAVGASFFTAQNRTKISQCTKCLLIECSSAKISKHFSWSEHPHKFMKQPMKQLYQILKQNSCLTANFPTVFEWSLKVMDESWVSYDGI